MEAEALAQLELNKMQRTFIVDGYSILFRTYYSVGEMSTSQNVPVGGVFGFARAILTLIRRYKPANLIIALDSGKKTFRSQIYEEYKANRISVPESLVPQFKILDEFLQASQIAHLRCDGFEADDIIASLTKNHNQPISVVSSDKDLMQLVNATTNCLDFFQGKFFNTEDVIAKFGINPLQIVDYLALIGDTSDNIPGVRGIGPKGAVKLLQEFQTVEGILENIANISNKKTQEIIQHHQEVALLSKKLASLRFDVEIPPIKTETKLINAKKMIEFLNKYEMKSLLNLCNSIANELLEEKPQLKQTSLF